MNKTKEWTMESSKPWYLSRTVWASLVTVAAAVGGLMGMSIAASDQALMTEALLQIVTAVGGVIAILGRLSATEKIGR
jgi:hypothetical protein